jgi:hypothetical protein
MLFLAKTAIREPASGCNDSCMTFRIPLCRPAGVRRHSRAHSSDRSQGPAQTAPAPTPPTSSGHFSKTRTNNAAGETCTQGEPRKGMGQHLRVDLGGLTAMRYTVASLRCVPQSMQGVQGVIQSLFLFDVVSGYVKQLLGPSCKCFLCLRNALRESGVINLKQRSPVQIPPRSEVQRFRIAVHLRGDRHAILAPGARHDAPEPEERRLRKRPKERETLLDERGAPPASAPAAVERDAATGCRGSQSILPPRRHPRDYPRDGLRLVPLGADDGHPPSPPAGPRACAPN